MKEILIKFVAFFAMVKLWSISDEVYSVIDGVGAFFLSWLVIMFAWGIFVNLFDVKK